MNWTSRRLGDSRYWSVALIVAASIGLGLPALYHGMPLGHDSFEHVSRYSSVASQLRQGEIYPRWLANMNAGLGSPVLFVYAPLPYFVPGFLSPLLRLGFGKNEPFELGVSVWLALALSGISVWLWLRMIVSGRAATIAAILYMLMPYHLTIDLYNRGAIGEMWAFVSMPMTLYCSTRLFRHRSSKVCDGGASHELRRPALHASLYRIYFYSCPAGCDHLFHDLGKPAGRHSECGCLVRSRTWPRGGVCNSRARA